jgi:hypothetical protein
MEPDKDPTQEDWTESEIRKPREWQPFFHGLNVPGFIMFGCAGGITIGVFEFFRLKGAGLETLFVGAIFAGIDLSYRIIFAGDLWYRYKVGGIFLF